MGLTQKRISYEEYRVSIKIFTFMSMDFNKYNLEEEVIALKFKNEEELNKVIEQTWEKLNDLQNSDTGSPFTT